jgi:hypothetical protein
MFKIQRLLKREIKNYIRILSIAIILFPAFGNAKDVRIGPDIVSMSIPRGSCYLDSTKQPDNTILQNHKEFNKGVNEVLLAYANCSQLKLLRSGEKSTIDHYGYVLAPTSLIDKKLNVSVEDYLSRMLELKKKKGAEVFNKKFDEKKDFIKEKLPLLKVNEPTFLGIFAQNKDAIFSVILHNIETETGDRIYMVGVEAITLIRKKPVYFYLWNRYQGNSTLPWLLDLIACWVDRTCKDNDNQ